MSAVIVLVLVLVLPQFSVGAIPEKMEGCGVYVGASIVPSECRIRMDAPT
jgi:hypothetical protein